MPQRLSGPFLQWTMAGAIERSGRGERFGRKLQAERVRDAFSLIARPRPNQPREPGSAFIDASLSPNEPIQGFGIGLVDGRVPHEARPFAPSTLVGFGWVGGAPNDGGERVFGRCKRRARSISRPSALHYHSKPKERMRTENVRKTGAVAASACRMFQSGSRFHVSSAAPAAQSCPSGHLWRSRS
jgi:hypothetical protein